MGEPADSYGWKPVPQAMPQGNQIGRLMDEQALRQAGKRLESWRRTMILTHERPDGDALGATGAMKRAIEAAGRQADALVFGDVPPRYAFLDKSCGLNRWNGAVTASLDGEFDGILVLDTSSWTQLETAASYLRGSRLPRIVLDHHTTPNELAGNGAELITLVDSSAASACGLVWQWCEVMGWPVDQATAEAIFTGLITDTGWFRFSNTDSATMRAAVAMMDRGARPEVLYGRLYESWSPARLKLKARLLNSMELAADGRVAVMSLTLKDFAETGAIAADSEELVNEPMAIGSVAATALLIEMEGAKVRVNLRSKSPDVCGMDVNVAALAQTINGGGHRRAAGGRVSGSLAEVKSKIVELLGKAIASRG